MSTTDSHDQVTPPRVEATFASRTTPPFAALRAFDAFGRTGSMRRAARDLGIDHSAVSRHVRALETWVGVQLVERGQAGGRLTQHGERYHRRVSAALHEIHAATANIMEPDVGGPLRIWCASGFAAHWLAPRLGEFRQESGLDLEVQPTEVIPNFATGEADADIRFLLGRRRPERMASGVKSVELSRPDVIPVASPDFVARNGPICRPADVLRLPLLHKKTDEQWRAWLVDQGLPPVSRLPGLRLWLSTMTLEAARSGQGVALSNAALLHDDLATGRLVPLDIGRPITSGAYFFTTRSDRWQSPPIARLRRWLQQAMTAA